MPENERNLQNLNNRCGLGISQAYNSKTFLFHKFGFENIVAYNE